MVIEHARTRIRSLDVYDDSGFPLRLELESPTVRSRWPGWWCAVTGRLRLRARDRRIESIRVCVVSTIVDVIAVEPCAADRIYRFGALISTFGLASPTEIFLDVLLDDGANFTVCRIEVECEIPAPRLGRYAPILINALPRSGTTWLASLLAQHPEIVSYPRYPYEVRQAIYWMSVLRTLTNPYNNPLERREMRFLVEPAVTRGTPYYTGFLEDLVPWFATEYAEGLAEFARGTIEKFYAGIEVQAGPAKNHARRFVEKFPGRVPPLTLRWVFSPVSEIYLIRHPVDVFGSIFRFNRKRGYPDFGEETFGRSEALFRHVALESRETLTLFEDRCRDGSGIIVRYEELVLDPRSALSRLLACLGLDRSEAVIESMISLADRERVGSHTTGQPGPVGRDPELTIRERAWVSEHFGGLLARFYPGSGD